MKGRNFIKVAVAGVSFGSTAWHVRAQQTATSNQEPGNIPQLPQIDYPGELRGEMLYRQLGGTGERVSVIGLGGSHTGKPSLTPSESIRVIHQAIDRGITFVDNSWDYNEGQSEMRMGKALSEDVSGKSLPHDQD